MIRARTKTATVMAAKMRAAGATMARRPSAAAGAAAGLLLLAGVALGCGGKHADTTPAGGGAASTGGGEAAGGPGNTDFVPPETLDEINRSLERKRPVMSRCLALAVDNKELPKNSAGKLTVEIVISPSGTVASAKIVKTSLESKMLEDCVINHVKEIPFPQLPRQFETSYTYGFEAM